MFLCFAAAFLVKMPAFPLHGWLPDGYRTMPLPALSAFSGVVSKVAAYGFLRIVLPIFPAASVHFQTLLLLIALASILYGSAMAFSTTNARLVVGFSSVAQMGFITLGIFALNEDGVQGALLQMVNHGLVTLPLFFIVGLLAARAGGSEDLRDMGGIAFRAPVLASLFLIVALATLAMPGQRQLRRRVPDPARRLQSEDRLRVRRLGRRRDGRRLRAARVHPRDAQPRGAERRLARGDVRRPRRARADRARRSSRSRSIRSSD